MPNGASYNTNDCLLKLQWISSKTSSLNKNPISMPSLFSSSLKRRCLLVCFTTCLSFASSLTFGKIATAQRNSGPALVAVGKVGSLKRAAAQSFVGTLQSVRKSTIGTAVEGRVLSINVEPGDPVSAVKDTSASETKPKNFVGQTLVQLQTGTLEIEIGASEIQVKLSQQAVDELSVSLPQEIALAAANSAEAKARLSFSKNNYTRSQRLRDGAISQGELEQAKSQYLADQQSARAAQIDYERIKSTRKLRVLQTQLNVQASKQELARLNDLKSKYTIRAPFEGIVTQKLTDVGEWVTKGQAVVEIVQLNPIQMIVNAPQSRLNDLQQSLGNATKDEPLTVDIQIDGYDKPLKGIVKRIVPQVDLRSRTFPVRIEIQNPMVGSSYALQPGMLGRASLNMGKVVERLVVKKDAIVLGVGSPKVFKVIPPSTANGDASVIGVDIKTGDSYGDWIEVTGDLTTKDEVVVLGNERLQPNQAIKVSKVIEDSPE